MVDFKAGRAQNVLIRAFVMHCRKLWQHLELSKYLTFLWSSIITAEQEKEISENPQTVSLSILSQHPQIKRRAYNSNIQSRLLDSYRMITKVHLSGTASNKQMEKALECFVDDFINNASVHALGPRIDGLTRKKILTEVGLLLFSTARASVWKVPLLMARFTEIFKKMCELEVGAMRLLLDVEPLSTTLIMRSLCQADLVSHQYKQTKKLREMYMRMKKEAFQLAIAERLDILLKEKDEKVRKLMRSSLLSHIHEGSDVISIVIDDAETSRQLIIKYSEVFASDAQYNIQRIKQDRGFFGYTEQRNINCDLTKKGCSLAKSFKHQICQQPFLKTAISDQDDFVGIIVRSMVFYHLGGGLPEWLLTSEN